MMRPSGRLVTIAIGCAFAAAMGWANGAASVLAQTASSQMNRLSDDERAQGWRLLFDGASLNGWTPTGTADWQVKDGAITFTTGRGALQTADTYDNFRLRVDFSAEVTANSGVFVRVTPRGQASAFYEINIFDTHATAPTGSVIAVEPGKPPAPVKSTLPERYDTAGKWNSFEILKLGRGPIQLQAGGPDGPGIAHFRNIRIKTL
jgi:hypothetical protein